MRKNWNKTFSLGYKMVFLPRSQSFRILEGKDLVKYSLQFQNIQTNFETIFVNYFPVIDGSG